MFESSVFSVPCITSFQKNVLINPAHWGFGGKVPFISYKNNLQKLHHITTIIHKCRILTNKDGSEEKVLYFDYMYTY